MHEAEVVLFKESRQASRSALDADPGKNASVALMIGRSI